MYNINEILDRPTLLEQLAEEAAELTKAALKLSRVLRDENPTPITETEAVINLLEEYTDVIQTGRELGLKPNEKQICTKNDRWGKRLMEKFPGLEISKKEIDYE